VNGDGNALAVAGKSILSSLLAGWLFLAGFPDPAKPRYLRLVALALLTLLISQLLSGRLLVIDRRSSLSSTRQLWLFWTILIVEAIAIWLLFVSFLAF
jgi:hypothetical protein